MENRLDAVHITVNKNAIPNDPKSPFVTSGVRIGTPAVTSRGFVESDMQEVARLIGITARPDWENYADELRARVKVLCDAHPIYE